MFDELDDPAFAAPGPEARAAVAARATSIRRRRRTAWAGGATSVVLVVAAIVQTAGGDGGGRRGLDVVSESETPPVTPEPSWDPGDPTWSTEPTPTPTGGTTPTQVAQPGPTSPAPEPTDDGPGPWRGNEPDGKPGWGGGFSGCSQWKVLPPAGEAPFADMTLQLRLPSTTLKGGQTYEGRLVVTNNDDRRVRFSVMEYDHQPVLDDGRGHLNGRRWSDAIMSRRVDLSPGGSVEIVVPVNVWSCGDTSDDPNDALPAGRYTISAALHWGDRAVATEPGEPEPSPTGTPILPTGEPSPEPSPEPTWGPVSGSGSWGTPRFTVTVTE